MLTDNAKVLVQTVPNEYATEIDEQSQLLVCDFEGNQGMP